MSGHACIFSTQSNTMGGDMHRAGLQTAKIEEEEASCAAGLCLLQFSASVYRCRTHPSLHCYARQRN